ncbi:MAG: hypothetical protein WC421_06285 [Elusimicrobiales bacterium]
MKLMLLVLSLAAAPASYAGSYRAEWLYQESLALYNAGKYEAALVGFMDALQEEPDHEKALEFMRRSGQKLAEKEYESDISRRDELFKDAEMINVYLPELRRKIEARLAAWQAKAVAVSSMAVSGESPALCWQAYGRLMAAAPVSADPANAFNAQASSLRLLLMKETAAAYPALAAPLDEIRKKPLSYKAPKDAAYSADERAALAAMRGAFESEGRARAAMLSARDAMALYRAGSYAESSVSWDEVLAFDPSNQQALFYGPRARGRVSGAVVSLTGGGGVSVPDIPHYGEVASAVKPAPAAQPAVAEETASARPAPAPEEKAAVAAEHAAPEASVPAVSAAAPAAPAAMKAPAASAEETASSRRAVIAVPVAPSPASGPAKSKVAADALYAKGLRFYAKGDSRAAAALWRQCLEAYPAHPRALRALERIKREIGE